MSIFIFCISDLELSSDITGNRKATIGDMNIKGIFMRER